MSQVQLCLPFCAIVVSHFVLGEVIDAVTIVGAILITVTVLGGRLSLGGDSPRRHGGTKETQHSGTATGLEPGAPGEDARATLPTAP
jgi:hypothetical protein